MFLISRRKIWKNTYLRVNINSIPYDIQHKAITDMKKAGFNDSFVKRQKSICMKQ